MLPTQLRRILALAAIAVGLVTLAACGGDDNESGGSSATTSAQFTGPTEEVDAVPDGGTWAFKPESITVASGTRVTWINKSNVPHNVIFDDPSLPDSDLFSENKTYAVVVSKAGTYTYVCTIHPGMKAEIVVQ